VARPEGHAKVTGFLGTGDKPVALSEEEVSGILFRSETAKDKPRLKIKFEKTNRSALPTGRLPTSTAWWMRSTKIARR